ADLTPHDGVRAQVVGLDRHFPNELLAGLNLEDRRVFDVYRIDLASGEKKLDTKNPGDVLGWQTDPQFRVRAAQASTPDGGVEVRYREDDKSPWKVAVRWSPGDNGGRLLEFTADCKTLCTESS